MLSTKRIIAVLSLFMFTVAFASGCDKSKPGKRQPIGTHSGGNNKPTPGNGDVAAGGAGTGDLNGGGSGQTQDSAKILSEIEALENAHLDTAVSPSDLAAGTYELEKLTTSILSADGKFRVLSVANADRNGLTSVEPERRAGGELTQDNEAEQVVQVARIIKVNAETPKISLEESQAMLLSNKFSANETNTVVTADKENQARARLLNLLSGDQDERTTLSITKSSDGKQLQINLSVSDADNTKRTYILLYKASQGE